MNTDTYRAPKAIATHPGVEQCVNDGDIDYRHDVFLREGWAFTEGRMAGCRSGMFNTVREFIQAKPTQVRS